MFGSFVCQVFNVKGRVATAFKLGIEKEQMMLQTLWITPPLWVFQAKWNWKQLKPGWKSFSRELPLLKFGSQCMSFRQTLAKAGIQPEWLTGLAFWWRNVLQSWKCSFKGRHLLVHLDMGSSDNWYVYCISSFRCLQQCWLSSNG